MEQEPYLSQLLGKVKELATPEKICDLSPEKKAEYNARLERLIAVNNGDFSNEEKGRALEDLVACLLKMSGNIFSVIRNVRTHTNEIDQLVELNENGKIYFASGLLPKRLAHFLGECKNYTGKIDVTYVGKFYSLLLTTSETTGILFSYHGITGHSWSHASGLIRKIYLQREDENKRVAILDFSLDDFQKIADGENLLNLIDYKLKALKYDTEVDQFLKKHPAEDAFQTNSAC